MTKNINLTQEKILLQGTIEIEKWTRQVSWYQSVWNILSSLRAFF